jgi:hypothetical protein
VRRLLGRLRAWWSSGYEIKVQTEQEIRSGGLLGWPSERTDR